MAQIDTLEKLQELYPTPGEVAKLKVFDYVDEQAQAFIARSSFLCLATENGTGRIEVSPKGDDPGFVAVEDKHTLLLPDRFGNNVIAGLRSILVNPNVGIIFFNANSGDVLRVSGQATIHNDDDILDRLTQRDQRPRTFLRIKIDIAYFHCARAMIRSKFWKPETWPEPFKVSFGKIVKQRKEMSEEEARKLDEKIDRSYDVN